MADLDEAIREIVEEILSETLSEKIEAWFDDNSGEVASTLTSQHDVASESYVDERIPDTDDFLTDMDWDDLGSQIESLADSMPTDYASRCGLGRSVTDVVMKVLGDADALEKILDGVEEHGSWGSRNRLAAMLRSTDLTDEAPGPEQPMTSVTAESPKQFWLQPASRTYDESGYAKIVGPFDSRDDVIAWANRTGRHGDVLIAEAK